MSPIARRDFLKAATGLVVTSSAMAWEGQVRSLRCAVIGVGGRGTGLLETVLTFTDVDVIAVCDINPDRLKNAVELVSRSRGKAPDAYGEGPYHYRQILKRDDVDCCVIATPCHWHGIMFREAMTAGKHFYGEKPMAITVREIELIQEAQRRNPKVVVQIGFQWGASRQRADIVRRIRDGAIGELIEGRFYRHNGWGSLGGWFNRRELSGDWMLEQAVHEFNLLWWVTGQHPLAATTYGRQNVVEPDNRERNVTDFYTTILEYPKGFVVHYTHGWISPPAFTGMATHIIGTEGAADLLGNYIVLRKTGERIYGQGEPGDTRELLRNFFDAVHAGDPKAVYCGIENGAAASYVGLMIRKSLYERRRVTFKEMIQDNKTLPPLPPS